MSNSDTTVVLLMYISDTTVITNGTNTKWDFMKYSHTTTSTR